jgi:ABC-type spermidine/putrescine transport system permease subunit I
MKRTNKTVKQKIMRGMRIRRNLFASPYIVWMAAFIVAPMVLILYYAFTSDSGLTVENIVQAASWDNMRVLIDSVRFALYTTLLCLLLGYPVAYLLSHDEKDDRGAFVRVLHRADVDEFPAAYLRVEGAARRVYKDSVHGVGGACSAWSITSCRS